MKIGYSRVSTADQDPQLQIDALEKAGCEKIFTDHASGAKAERPELTRCLDQLRSGDVLVVWKLDRLGRSLKHLLEVVDGLKEKGVAFASLTEGFDTSTNGGRLIFTVFGGLAEFERGLIIERTNAGLAAARARGKMGGRPGKLTTKQVATLRKMHESREHAVAEIARTFGISRVTVYQYLKKG